MTIKTAARSDGLDAPAAQDEDQVGAGKTAQSNNYRTGENSSPAISLLILLADSLKRFIVSLLVDKSSGFRHYFPLSNR